MKRISFIVLATLFVTSGAAEAYSVYRYPGYDYGRVRWSMYTFSLIPGDLYYSPYAYGSDQSGLVPTWVRYSPYAFGLDHPSGLVNDFAISQSSIYYDPQRYVYTSPGWNAHDYGVMFHGGSGGSSANQRPASYAACVQARKDRLKERQQARQEEKTTAGSGGDQIVAAYLKSKNIDFRMNRALQIAGKTISADFELTGRNATIKYWDPVAILALDQQAPYRKRAYESYLQSWKDYSGQYQLAGGKIYSIISADSGQILAKLAECSDLQGAARTYAMAQGTLVANR